MHFTKDENRFREGKTFVRVTYLSGGASAGTHVRSDLSYSRICALYNMSTIVKTECPRCSGKKMKLPVRQGFTGKLLVFVSCGVIG